MELSELTVASFANLLGSDAPAPGGGSAAALQGALGAALCAMVSALTLGRKKYEDAQQLAEDGYARASELKDAFLSAMERDTEVFQDFSAALALPKTTEDERLARSERMQEALLRCTESPLSVMELCVQSLELTGSLLGKTNVNAVSDLGVAALSLGAALRSAWLNVLINLPGLRQPALADAFREKGEALLQQGVALSGEITRKVENSLS